MFEIGCRVRCIFVSSLYGKLGDVIGCTSDRAKVKFDGDDHFDAYWFYVHELETIVSETKMEYSVNLTQLRHLMMECGWDDVIKELDDIGLDFDEPEEIQVTINEKINRERVLNEVIIWTSHYIYKTYRSMDTPTIRFISVERLIDRSLARLYPQGSI